ncbi:MAG: two-component system NarL family sensor kinase, partial [Flavobacterium sp.]
YVALNTYQVCAISNILNSKEISNIETSLEFLFEIDSTFQNKYDHIVQIYREENYVKALAKILKLEEDPLVNNKNSNLYFISFLKGDIYNKTKNYKRALKYYKESLVFLKRKSIYDTNRIDIFNKNLAETYLKIGGSFHQLTQRDSAKYYYNKVENLPNLNKDILIFKAMSYVNLSGIYQQDSIYDLAINYARRALSIHEKNNSKVNQASALNSLGNIYVKLGKFEVAKEIYNKGIALTNSEKSEQANRYTEALYYNLAWTMRKLKDYEAYDYQEISYDMRDTIRDKEFRKAIEQITAENNVDDVKREEKDKRLRERNTFWVFTIISLIIIISLVYWLSFYKLKQKNLGLKLSQTELLQNQNIEKLKSESQIRILNATIDAKESERKEIAETLHDSVSALLSSANLHLIAVKVQFKGDIPTEIIKTQKIISEASLQIRDLSHTLVSAVLLKFGLNFALKDMASKYSNSALHIEIDIDDLRRYHQNFEIKVHNIIQEFVNNILKHSKAQNAFIRFYEENNRICFQIFDDGIGFDKMNIFDKDGLGLNQIDARIQIMDGNFLVESAVGEGTTISVELPIVEKDAVTLA